MVDWHEKRQLVKVANLYYKEGLTQADVAKKLKVSRPVISKLLQKAKEEGIVNIYIKDESVMTVELEQKLEQYFHLESAIVVPNDNLPGEMAKQAIGQAGATYISRNLKNVQSIGISWGTTLASLIQEYPYERRNDIQVVPLEGGMGVKEVEIHANHLANELAKKIKGQCTYLYAPAIVATEELKERLMAMQDIELVLQSGRNVDMAIIGIGNPYKESTLMKIGYLQEDDLSQLQKLGVVGDIGFRFYNNQGIQVDDTINKRVIGISLEELKNIETVIALVEGQQKAESVLGALHGRIINVLIIDEKTASAVINKYESENEKF
ncbi:sugar-binding transcriptional regulator [Cytobacillus firmus]|uniref:sugar-binding transcriptional regulator n=1 Tax=Cytobacillus firmus TaxID=1399 RepID=UPI002030B3B5|nr:sugar-binding transcriptional regulator [Cytobacillus firmus]URT73445.1 sugar-binding transcriptional regulator [Cytobacillus firmus]